MRETLKSRTENSGTYCSVGSRLLFSEESLAAPTAAAAAASMNPSPDAEQTQNAHQSEECSGTQEKVRARRRSTT